MNILKSLFISLFIMLAMVIFVKSLTELSFSDLSYEWLGTAISSASVLGFFSWVFILKPPRTTINLWLFSALILIGTVLSLAAGSVHEFGFQPFLLSSFIFGLWLLYLYWYSFFSGRSALKIKVGEAFPPFSAINEKGEAVTEKSFLGSPTLLLFYRGNWCPLCMAQINEIADKYRAISEGGTEIFLVSPQSASHTKRLARRFNVPFNFIIDRELKLAKILNNFHDNGTPFGIQVFGFDSDTVYPLVVILDQHNKVAWIDQTDNYRLRPVPGNFISVINNLSLNPTS
ncbi:MAG: redoxin domain-containing protein [Bacteroidota bacterium]